MNLEHKSFTRNLYNMDVVFIIDSWFNKSILSTIFIPEWAEKSS